MLIIDLNLRARRGISLGTRNIRNILSLLKNIVNIRKDQAPARQVQAVVHHHQVPPQVQTAQTQTPVIVTDTRRRSEERKTNPLKSPRKIKRTKRVKMTKKTKRVRKLTRSIKRERKSQRLKTVIQRTNNLHGDRSCRLLKMKALNRLCDWIPSV